MSQDAEIKKIISKIKEDAEREAEKIREEARKKEEEILQKAEAEAKSKSDEILNQGKKEAELEKQRILANAKLQAKKIKLDVKEKIIEKSFSLAEEKLKEVVSSEEYEKILKDLIREAISTIGREDLEVLCRKEDEKVVKKIIKDLSGVELAKDNISTIGGVIVRSKDRQVQVDNTFEARLTRMRDNLRIEVAKILFGGKT